MPTIWKGQNLTIRSRDEHYGTVEDLVEVTLTYEGQITALRANKPPTNSFMAGYTNVLIEDVRIANTGEGDKGTMTVQGSNRTTLNIDEIEWTRVDEDLRFHKIFQTSGTYVLTDANRLAVEAKLSAPTDNTIATPSGNSYELYKRLLRGQTTYPVYIPICRRTNYYFVAPSGSGCGQPDSPAVLGHPTQSGNGKTYQYVLTAFRKCRRGFLWEVVREWAGFEQIDTVIIGAT